MTKFKLFLAALAVSATAVFTACDPENGLKNITVSDSGALTQEVFADEQQGNSGVSFTTTGGAGAQAAANETEWISISPDHGEAAGTYTIVITLTPNTTGADRTAIITITCGETEIKITLTQKGTTEGGEQPEIPLKLVSRIDYYSYWGSEIGSGGSSGVDIQSYEYRYDGQNRLTEMIFTDDYRSGGQRSTSTTTVTYPDDNTIVLNITDSDNEMITCTLNGEGHIVAMVATDEYGNQNSIVNMTYAGGWLQKVESPETFVDNRPVNSDGTVNEPVTYHGTHSATYTWQNGNIKTLFEEGKFPDYPSGNWHIAKTFEYGNTPNKPCSIDLSTLFVEDLTANVPVGWFGKSGTNLPSIIREQDYTNFYPSFIDRFYRYETDSNGYPLRIFEQEKVRNQNGNDPEYTSVYEEQLRCTISYQ